MIRNKDNKYPPVVITGLCDPMSLCIIRSLGRRGIPIIAIDSTISSCYGKTKYCEKLYCKSLFDSSLIESLLKLAQSFEQKAVLFNCTDQSVRNVSGQREVLEEYYDLVLPPNSTIEQLMSKRSFYNFAVTNNFLVPKTFFSHTHEETERIGNEISYPCVIKPEFRDAHWLNHVPSKVLVASSKDEYRRYFEELDIANRSLVMQEWIEGSDDKVFFCLAYIDRNHDPLAAVAGRKIRQYPRGSGSTSLAESVMKPHLLEESLRLLKTAGCIGFCSVEFKWSTEKNLFYVIEPTVGRPDTQEGLSVGCGIDIPYIAYLDAIGHSPAPVAYRERNINTIKWINEPFDIFSIQDYLKHGHTNLMELVMAYKAKNRTYALWAIDDPLPFIHFASDLSKKAIIKIVRLAFEFFQT